MADVEKKTVQIDLELDTSIVDSSKNKYQGWIDLAKAVDAWRIFPRLFLTVYIFLLYYSTMWLYNVLMVINKMYIHRGNTHGIQ